jgi:hypothetical protein
MVSEQDMKEAMEWLDATPKKLVAHCGRSNSRSGRPFTRQSLRDHTRNCRKCIEAYGIPKGGGYYLWYDVDGALCGKKGKENV